MSGPNLRRVVIERQDDGRWSLLRERDGSGEKFVVGDLREGFEVVLAAYRPDGTPRAWPPRRITIEEPAPE